MSIYKSEVLAVKIKLKVKFSQAVITKIKTLPPVFLRHSKKLYDRKLWTAASDIMYVVWK